MKNLVHLCLKYVVYLVAYSSFAKGLFSGFASHTSNTYNTILSHSHTTKLIKKFSLHCTLTPILPNSMDNDNFDFSRSSTGMN